MIDEPDIYIVDDDPVTLATLRSILCRRGFRVRTNSDSRLALAEIAIQPPSILITDWHMPDMTGGQLCQAIRRLNLPRYIYTIVITSNPDDFVVEALDSGADDFITKPVDPSELTSRMRAGTRILDLEERLKTLSERDSLTGLFNRSSFFGRFERAFQVARKHQANLSCIMMDLDFFKTINDEHGHLAGDEVLRRLGAILDETVPDDCVSGRYGGEEFCILMPDANADEAIALTGAIRKRLAAETYDFIGVQSELKVTASFGVAELTRQTITHTQLVNSADQNLLLAKRLGRDQTVGGTVQDANATNDTSRVGVSTRR